MTIKVVVFGNCQAGILSQALNTLDEVHVDYHFVWFNSPEEESRALGQLAGADFILGQTVTQWKKYSSTYLANGSANVIEFPFLRFGALWPFDGHQNGGDPGHTYKNPSHPFAFADAIMGKLRNVVPGHDQRLSNYRAMDFEGSIDLGRYLELEQARLVAEDRKLGFSLGEFINDNFRQIRLFHTITHPAKPLMERLATALCKKIGLTPRFDRTDFDKLHLFQVPLHPLVIEELKIKWVDKNSTYNFHGREQLSFDEYFRKYINTYG